MISMPSDPKALHPPLDRLTDLGIIDNWLRGIARIVPQAAADRDISRNYDVRVETAPDPMRDFNVHTLRFEFHAVISHDDIRRMAGFCQLVQACARNDVRLDIVDQGAGRLRIGFDPGFPFRQSRALGRSATEALSGCMTAGMGSRISLT